MRKSALAVLVVISLAAGAIAGDRVGGPSWAPPREFPAKASEIEAIRGLQAEARELDEARRRLEARAQLVLEEARERLGVDRKADFRYDIEKRVFFVVEIAPTTSSTPAPVSSR